MYQVVVISFVFWLALGKIADSQRVQQATNYPSRHRNSYHPHMVPPSLVAHDRRYSRLKHLKKFQPQKFQHFKKYFKKCGISPFKFQIFRRSDDGDVDTIHVMVPYGFQDEYFRRPEQEIHGGTEEIDSEGVPSGVVPVQFHPKEMPKSRNLYSVRYRNDTGNSDHANGTIHGTDSNLRR